MKTRAKRIWLFPEIPAWQGEERQARRVREKDPSDVGFALCFF